MGDLVAPQWLDATALVMPPFLPVPQSKIQYMVDAWGRVQLHGEIGYQGGNPGDGVVIMQCPSGTTPPNPVTVMAVEDVAPARMYRVDVQTDGNLYLRFPVPHSTGLMFLDNISWMTQ
jgi:hypothetical protein